jgi:hypothetical protein
MKVFLMRFPRKAAAIVSSYALLIMSLSGMPAGNAKHRPGTL